MRQQTDKREKIRNANIDREEIAKLVHELLLDDLPEIYNDEYVNETVPCDLLFLNGFVSTRKLNEIKMLENSIRVEKDKQKTHADRTEKRNELMILLRLTLKLACPKKTS